MAAPAAAAAHPPMLDPLGGVNFLAQQRAGFGSPQQAAQRAAAADAQARALRAQPASAPAQNTAGITGAWQPLGPQPVTTSFYGGPNSGRVDSIAVAQTAGTHTAQGQIFVGTAGGGVWTTTNSGTSWTESTPDNASTGLAIGAIAIDPSNPDVIYAGTGEANNCGDCFYGGGVLKSTDGGSTWNALNPGGIFSGVEFAQIAVDPNNSQHVWATTSNGLYLSTNGGTSWAHPAGDTSTNGAWGLALDPTTTPTTVYVATSNTGIQKSTDGGTTFPTLAGGLPLAAQFGVTQLGIGSGSSGHNTLYAAIQLNTCCDTNNGDLSMFKTTNGGTNWSQLAIPAYANQSFGYGSGTSDQAYYDNTIAVDPANPNHVIAAGIGIVEVTDGGSTSSSSDWTNVNGQDFFGGATNVIHPDFHAIAFTSPSSGAVVIGCDGGVYKYSGGGSTHVTNLNTNLNTTQFYEGLSVFNNGAQLLGGLQDNGTVLSSNSVGWPDVRSGDGNENAINPLDSTQQFAGGNQGLDMTTDTWGTLTTITPTGSVTNFVPPLAVVPNSGSTDSPTIFFGMDDLWETRNPTASPFPTWTQLTSIGTGVSAVAVAPSNPAVLYVGFDDGTLLVSTNATAAPGSVTFTNISGSLPAQWITHIDVNPSNPGQIALSFSNNNTQSVSVAPMVETGIVTLAGTPSAAYTNITGNLPNGVSSNSVVSDAGVPGTLIVATDVGVFSTSSPSGGATSWTAVGTALPNVQVVGLSVDAHGSLYAVTHGRGAWKLVVVPPPANTALPTISGTPQQDRTLTVTQGVWTNSPTAIADQWQDCDSSGANCSNIAGATGSGHALTAADVGHTVRVVETASNFGGSGVPVSSAATGVVLPAPPSNATLPSLSGRAQQGQVLTVTQGAWSNSPTSIADQWQDCDSAGSNCSNISGATGSSYTPAASDVGHTIRVTETASNAGGTGGPASSAATGVVVLPAPVSTAPPAVSGTAQQGQALTVTQGSWSNSPTSIADQWQDCDSSGNNCSNISGATGSSYTLAASDVGHTIRVAEMASNAGGSGGPANSAATSVVLPLPPGNTSVPAVSGTARQGQALTVTQGSWSNSPTSIADQWQDCDSAGSNCSNIAGATGPSYTLAAADVGHTIRVVETASNAGGTGGPASSAATGQVAPLVGVPSVLKLMVSGTKLTVKLSCRGGPCQLQLALTATVPGKRGKLQTVGVGGTSVSISAGGTATVTMSLNAAGKRLVRQRGRLRVRLNISQGGQSIGSRTVNFSSRTRHPARRAAAVQPVQDILQF